MTPGPRNLLTDVTGLRVGNAHDTAAKTGATVVTGDAPFVTGVAVMGGAPGTRETDLLAPDKMVRAVDALVLSGGSAFGLAAADGAMGALAAAGRGHVIGPATIPIVPAAIIFDLLNGGAKDFGENAPYRKLGADAAAAAGEDFGLGTAGAGYGALTAGLKGGLGSSSLVLPSGATVGAMAVVNAVGAATVPGSRRFWAAPWEIDDEFGGLGPAPTAPDIAETFRLKPELMAETGRNTTIAVVATDAKLDQAQATRMAWAAHDGMARALSPAHTAIDGDLVFAAATGARPGEADIAEQIAIGHAAAICLARAIARGVFEATPETGDIFPCWSEMT
ncbi:MAG: P1 family peptidase [Pseudomonadota bacterium]